MAAREIWSKALTPSMYITVACGYRRITSPSSKQRSPPSGLRSAVVLRTASTTTCGTLACANRSAECVHLEVGLQRLLSRQTVGFFRIGPRREQAVCVGHSSPQSHFQEVKPVGELVFRNQPSSGKAVGEHSWNQHSTRQLKWPH